MLGVIVEGIRMLAKRLVGVWSQKHAGLVLGIVAAGFASTGFSEPMPSAPNRVFIGDISGIPLAANVNPDTARNLNALRQQAAINGTVRVIVGMRAAFAPEGLMAAGDVALQRNEIAAAQSAVLNKVVSLKQKPEKTKRFEIIPFMAIEAAPAELEALANLPEIISIEEDRLAEPTLAQSVPLIGGTTAWSSGYTGAGRAIAILDSGVDKTHSFLAGKVVSEACYSTTSATNGSTSVCPAGVMQSTAAGSAMPYASGVCPAGKCNHGTHVAGIAAGKGTASTSHSGVAQDASLIAIQVFSRFDNAAICGSATPCVLTYTSDQILGLQRVYALRAAYNIAAVNMSLGGGQYFDQASCDAANLSRKAIIDTLRSVNIATVIASGNQGYMDSMNAPGCISSAISVGATWDDTGWTLNCGSYSESSSVDKVACFSNSASFLNLLAPGAEITSPIPGGGYVNREGTSMAAPHVAGAWALLKQKKATLTVTEGLNALSSAGVSVTDSRNGIVKPRININAALNAIASTCSYTLSSASFSAGAAAAIGNVSVMAAPGCAWTAASNVAWITVTSGASGNGNGAVGYSIAANTTASSRTGALAIAGKTFTVTQAAGSGADAFPPGGALPAGWVQPAGSNAAWVVTSDAAYAGGISLKSGLIADGQKSEISYTGTFNAGNISFARKVSSEGGWDYLLFYIDGVQQGGWSGEVPWSVVSFPVAAGTHTLLWRYSKDDLGGSAGADAAWIDSVSLSTQTATVPGAPTIGIATAGNGTARVAFTPGAIGSGTLLSYTAMCGSITATGTSPITVTGLTNGIAYTCKVRTTSTVGTGAWSAVSNTVTPSASVTTTGSLTTTFAGLTHGANGNMFDVQALSGNLTVNRFDLNLYATAGTVVPVRVYYKTGSYWGYEATPGAWTLLGTYSVTSAGYGSPSSMPVGNLLLTRGQTYGIYLTATDGTSFIYTSGANIYSNADLRADLGAGVYYPFGAVYSPREKWNGTIYYSRAGTSGTLPSAPTIGIATAGNGSVRVSFIPGAIGSGTLLSYTAMCGTITATGTSSPITVTGLTNGTAYTCKVRTTSTVGIGPWSALSNSVTPSSAVVMPDLVVTALTASPSTGIPGGQISITSTVTNAGATSAGAYRLGFYFSTDPTITTADTYSGSACSMSALAAGASANCSGPLTVPATLPPGTYYFGAIADNLNVVSESNEGNNTRATFITISGSGTLPPACSAITPATASVTLGSPSPLLTATCTNSPTSYVWKVGATTLSCSLATCTIPAASIPTAGTYNVTVRANNAAGAGTQAASATITVTAATGSLITWYPRNSNTTSILNSVIFAGGQFVAVGDAGAIVTSPDGVNWTPRSSGTLENIGKLAYGNGFYLAISGTGLLKSSNGINWINYPWGTPPSFSISSIAFGNGYFVMVGRAPSAIYRSIDGLSWTNSGNGGYASPGYGWNNVTFANGVFVAVGTLGRISTSIDGLTWTLRQAAGDDLLGVAYGSAGFLAAGTWHAVYASPGGGTWSLKNRTPSDSGTLWLHTFGAGYYILTGYWGDSYTTPDGVNFYNAGLPPGGNRSTIWNSVAYGNGTFVAVGKGGQIVNGRL